MKDKGWCPSPSPPTHATSQMWTPHCRLGLVVVGHILQFCLRLRQDSVCLLQIFWSRGEIPPTFFAPAKPPGPPGEPGGPPAPPGEPEGPGLTARETSGLPGPQGPQLAKALRGKSTVSSVRLMLTVVLGKVLVGMHKFTRYWLGNYCGCSARTSLWKRFKMSRIA